MKRSKSIFRSKLNGVGAILTAIGVAMVGNEEARNFFVQLIDMLPEGYRPLALSALGLLIIVLRTLFTSQAVEVKPKPELIE